MAKNLVIVESPAKAKTISKFLGSDYLVKSSFGHVRDLPKKGMSVDIDNGFKPDYQVSPDKKKVIAELKTAAKSADTVWLASDEDREGEAIAWHISELLNLKPAKTKRIVFHEITKPAIEAAVKKPRGIDQQLVDAYQARRILDRIVGYEISPVLWKKVRPGLSAGRVQSVEVRLIVDREREIENFKAETSFKVTALFKLTDGTELSAEAPIRYKTEAAAQKFLEELAVSQCVITGVQKTPGVRSPSPPFTTSTLQQEASRRLGYSPKYTMSLAQRLYENGHITYMRTDSLNLSDIAVKAMADLIKKQYGPRYLKTRYFKTKSAGAQEAHEAIRPSNFGKDEAGADAAQKKLYKLIWQRAVASQMAPAQIERTTITIGLDKSKDVLEAKGEVVIFDGYLKVAGKSKKAEDGLLPEVTTGDKLKLESAQAEQAYSRPAARYTEASLVRKLEELGIGRPSTYASTIGNIQDRGYVEKADVVGGEREIIRLKLVGTKIERSQNKEPMPDDKGKLVPTDVGKIVTDFLEQHFKEVVDYDFTKDVEAEFDEIADGKLGWQKMLQDFYGPFHSGIKKAENVSRAEAMQAKVLGKDPKSGRPVSARFGRFGPMVQLGDAEDEDKPKFASIPANLSLDNITLAQALELFKLPRELGANDKGEAIEANIGRYGPYLKVADRFVSIKGHDPSQISLATALKLLAEQEKIAAERTIADFGEVKILKGPYGVYITDGKKNARIPKDTEPKKITEAQAKELLAKAPVRKAFRRRHK